MLARLPRSAIIPKVRVTAKFLVVVAVGCGPKSASPGGPPPPPPPDAAKDPAISLVTSAVVIEQCPGSKKLDSKAATREIDELVGPCKTVPGGAAHFTATLLPDGSVELGGPSGGNPDEAVVPTCLVQKKNQLKHKLKLSEPCKFDVRLEQRLAEQQPHSKS
jgi:hypothetical protein